MSVRPSSGSGVGVVEAAELGDGLEGDAHLGRVAEKCQRTRLGLGALRVTARGEGAQDARPTEVAEAAR